MATNPQVCLILMDLSSYLTNSPLQVAPPLVAFASAPTPRLHTLSPNDLPSHTLTLSSAPASAPGPASAPTPTTVLVHSGTSAVAQSPGK